MVRVENKFIIKKNMNKQSLEYKGSELLIL